MNPVLRKDLLGLLRLRRVSAIQVFFVVVLAALLLATWPQQGVVSLASRGRDDLLLGLIVGQLVLLTLFVPGIAAVSLSGEREANTLEMLYASRLSAGQIIFGKIMSAISYPLLLLASGLPFVALLNYRGEVNFQKLAAAYLVLVLAAVFLAMVSLTVSAFSKQTASALAISYALVLVICGGVLVPAAIMLAGQSGPSAQVLHYARSLSPVAAAMSLLRPHVAEFGGRRGEGDVWLLLPSWQVFVPAAGLVIVGCFVALVFKLRKAPTGADDYRGAGTIAEGNRSLARKIMFLIDDKKKRKPIGNLNPLLAKESRTNNLRSGRWMIRIFYGMLFVSLALAVMSLYGGSEYKDLLAYVAQVMVAFQVGAVALIVPSLTSASISSEIENGTFETLRLTRLSGWQIFFGKFIPAFFPAALPVIAMLPAYGAIYLINSAYLPYFLRVLPVIVMAVVFCCVLGLTVSTFVHNTARATVVSYLIAAAVFVLPLFGWFAAGTQLGVDVAKWLAMPSPLVMALNLLPGEAATPQIGELWQEHLILMGVACVAMLVAARVRLTVLLHQG
jgi:ABC-type transport system involved in multi-copper enzyme maturation permease subunit